MEDEPLLGEPARRRHRTSDPSATLRERVVSKQPPSSDTTTRWHCSRPPNYPSTTSTSPFVRRSTDPIHSDYSTFDANTTTHSNCNNDSHHNAATLGLSTSIARQRLLRAIEQQVDEKERSSDFTREFRDPFALLLTVCAVCRFIDSARKSAAATTASSHMLTPLGEGLFLVAAAALNAWLNATQRRRHHDEIAERVRAAVANMVAHDSDAAWCGVLKAAHLLPSTSYVACYRDAAWQRLPTNLLVDGDVVGLMSGDVAPGAVELIPATHSADKPAIVPRGATVPSWSSQFAETTRCNATFNAPLLLELCGEMRLFRMRETPVVRDIEDALFRIQRPETYTQKLQATARRIAMTICVVYSIVVVVAIGVRAAVQHQSLETTIAHALVGPVLLWLCFASLNTPSVLFVAEAAASASILGAFESTVLPTAAATASSEATSTESDAYDVEDREKLRSEKAAQQSALRRSLAYLGVTLEFRLRPCAAAHASSSADRALRLPVPFRAFRLLERLGSTTMLCCFDDDILCEATPSVEEIFLLHDKPGGGAAAGSATTTTTTTAHTTVLDLHQERSCATGLKFEDPKWRQHLASLKPIGLAIMLNDTDDPAAHYSASMQYLVNEALAAAAAAASLVSTAAGSEDEDPLVRRCMQRLSAHVRMLPFPTHLLNLSREIGFAVAHDTKAFERQQSIHIICPRLAHHEHTTDHHDQGQDDTRYRGNLKTHLNATVVQDTRTNRYQLLSRGHPTLALAQCSEYWDGKSICPLTSDTRRAILDMYNQWRVEDLDCVAFSYVPVPHKLTHAAFTRTATRSNNTFDVGGRPSPSASSSYRIEMLPPVYLVDDSTAGDVELARRAEPPAAAAATTTTSPVPLDAGDNDSNVRPRRHSLSDVSPVASSTRSAAAIDQQQQHDIQQNGASDAIDTASAPAQLPPVLSTVTTTTMRVTAAGGRAHTAPKRRSMSPPARTTRKKPIDRPSGVASTASADAAATATTTPRNNPSETGSTERDALLWRIQDDQIFLGMVAAGVQPKQGIPEFIEDLTACGIRFVYFSPRNMRRSKLLAEKMGIETDWNCAISLRPLESDGPDPHRMTSNYSDWDVKARLPHGVDAIKRHLDTVDNVPLLVSLYTDSTPETISAMVSIFQENHEVVLGVGASLRAANASLFAKADTAAALHADAHTFFDDRLPRGRALPVFSDDDLEFSHILNTLACSFRISAAAATSTRPTSPSSNSPGSSRPTDANTSDATPSLTHLLELIRLGRCLLTNYHQLLAFMFVSQLFVATLVVASYVVPFPVVPQLRCAALFWLLWGLVPAVSLTMLASPSELHVMKQTPRKNEAIDVAADLPRLAAYCAVRHVPSVLFALGVFELLFGLSLVATRAQLPGDDNDRFRAFSWLDFVVYSSSLAAADATWQRLSAVQAAINRAEAGMLLAIALSLLASSSGYLYRCESIWTMSPLRNHMWVGTSALLLVVQFVWSIVRAGVVGVDGVSLTAFVCDVVPWYVWFVIVVAWPLTVVAVDECVKAHDRRHMTRYYKFLRMQFDTRLGMWSPK